MFKIIAIPFGWIMRGCYMLLKNYGLALLLFTVIIKLVMLPSSIKQQKSSARMARLAPKREQIMKKYANNREKQNEAMMELYNQEGVSPTGGCGTMIITYIILFAIIEVVYAPLTYISGLPNDKVNAATNTLSQYYAVSDAISQDRTDGENALTLSERMADGTSVKDIIKEVILKCTGSKDDTGSKEATESTVITEKTNNIKLSSIETAALVSMTEEDIDSMAETLEADPGIADYFVNPKKVSKRLIGRPQLIILSVAKDYPNLFDSEIVDFCENFDYTFLGFYLGEYPSWTSVYILIPILSFVFQIALTIISNVMMKRNGQDMQGAKGMMGMLYAMPVISFLIAFSFPAGIGIYWIYSSLTALIQTVCMNLYFTPERMDRILAKEKKKKSRRPSLYQLALEQQKAQQGGSGLLDDLDSTDEIKLSKNERKEIERRKINEARAKLVDDEANDDPRVIAARKKMAEKYGDSE